MAATVERLNELGHLSAGVGHHVINAFSAIVSSAELLRLENSKPGLAEPAELAETIVRTALEAATVARRLIDFSRPVTSIDPEQSVFTPDTLSLDQLAAEVMAAETSCRRVTIQWSTELAPLPPIRGHVSQLKAMLGHLIANADEAIPASGGTIELTTSTDARGRSVLELRDSGMGMDQGVRERAIEPFYSTKPGRLGVGLSIANGIWRRHRGTLSIRSQPGEGTVVRLCVEPLGEAGGSGK